MKKLVAAALLSAPLVVNAADFTGLNVWVGGQYTDSDVDSRDFSDGTTTNSDDTDFGLTLGADYGIELTDSTVLLIGASWSDKADIASDTSTTDGGFLVNVDLESDQSYMVYVAPGFKVGESSLLYAKLSYSEADAKLMLDVPAAGFSDSVSVDDKSVGFGFGFRSHLTDTMFLNAEIERVDYEYNLPADWELSLDTEITRASVSVGMTF